MSRACWATWTKASQSRAPPSRGSWTGPVPSVPPSCSSTAGAGQVNGSRAALSRAPSSAEPRPFTRTPPAPSAVMARYRSAWRGAGFAVELGFEPAVAPVGVDHLDQVPAGAGQVGGVEPVGVADQLLLGPPTQMHRAGEVGDRVDDDVGLLRGHGPLDHPGPGPGQRPGQRDRPADQPLCPHHGGGRRRGSASHRSRRSAASSWPGPWRRPRRPQRPRPRPRHCLRRWTCSTTPTSSSSGRADQSRGRARRPGPRTSASTSAGPACGVIPRLIPVW